MELDFGLLAEAALNKNGQLFIMGTCDRLHAQAFPLKLPNLSLVLRFSSHPSEAGEHEIAVDLVDADGRRVQQGPSLKGKVSLGPNQEGGWERRYADLVVNFQGLKLTKAGTFTFVVKSDGRHVGDVRFHVKKAQDLAA